MYVKDDDKLFSDDKVTIMTKRVPIVAKIKGTAVQAELAAEGWTSIQKFLLSPWLQSIANEQTLFGNCCQSIVEERESFWLLS